MQEDETDRKWGRRCSTREMVTREAPWWCPLGPITSQAKVPAQGMWHTACVSFCSFSESNTNLNDVGGACCHDPGYRCPTLQGDCIRVKDKTLETMQDNQCD